MLDTAKPVIVERRTEPLNWEPPLVSIIITHFNYSDFLNDALLSIMNQTHSNWECVVVDDGSSPEHLESARRTVEEFRTDKIRLLARKNEGQIPAFFAGLDETSGEFVCLLDPCDRYVDLFLELTISAHLNKDVFGPIVCTSQHLIKNGRIIASRLANRQQDPIRKAGDALLIEKNPYFAYYPAHTKGWQNRATSSMMCRRPALELLRPHKKLTCKRNANSYLGLGCHLLGGTIYIASFLTYRMLHRDHSWTSKMWSAGDDDPFTIPKYQRDVEEAIIYNGGTVPDSSTSGKDYDHEGSASP
jgi:glycosyltransferase involved in cell wall biosynthesis